MDPRLEDIDKLLASMGVGSDLERELAFALSFTPQDPAEMRWLAAVLAARAAELEEGELA